jgi:ABC-type amino acid transport system permease subunit
MNRQDNTRKITTKTRQHKQKWCCFVYLGICAGVALSIQVFFAGVVLSIKVFFAGVVLSIQVYIFFILVLFCVSRYIYWCCVFYPDNFAGVVLSMQVIFWCCLV